MTTKNIPATSKLAVYAKKSVGFFSTHKNHLLGITLVIAWCIPLLWTGSKLEWGDFSFFAQAYEAIRTSIIDYHQFPWLNPWVSGGVPLYANPQMGVFSIQTIFVFIFGAPLGLKVGLSVYTLLGYFSMYTLLRRYFKVDKWVSTLLSLLWIFCTFFVAHLPAHYTFAWYMIAPFFVYLALTFKGKKGGLILGLSFAIMALSQVHNPFVHIASVCGAIIVIRFILEYRNWRKNLIAGSIAALTFVAIAGHRILFTYQNISEFPRQLIDSAPDPRWAITGVLLPLSQIHPLKFLNYPQPPRVPHGYHETTATIGIFGLIALLFCVLYIFYMYTNLYTNSKKFLKTYWLHCTVLLVGLIFLSLGLGGFAKWAPYSLLKHFPVFSQMRVSMRWFLWFDLAILAFIGITYMSFKAKSFERFAVVFLLSAGVVEMFGLNVGYQTKILTHQPVVPNISHTKMPFIQMTYFGEKLDLPNGQTIKNDGYMPHAYREYEATMHNIGIIYANDALVELALAPQPTARCGYDKGCGFVLSGNADVTYWSPNKIVLTRTAPGIISLNLNDSSYYTINDKRSSAKKVAEPFKKFEITDESKTINIVANPSIIDTIKSFKD